MGDYVGETVIEPLTGSPEGLADQLREFEAAGAAHVQLCVDPITLDSIGWLGDVLGAFRRSL
jgi:alkanesulfonate monooxygenase SsuD/methylene tetrahydromethanopterin reductase-like flavin-dependent oxidoreductase (luciferase family)